MTMQQPYIPRSGDPASAPLAQTPGWQTKLKIWWREVDKVLLALVAILMLIGTAAVAAASPASANRLSSSQVQLPDLYFYWAHVRWQILGLAALFGVSFLSLDNARRLGILIAAGALFLLVLVPLIGVEVNGSRRWLQLGMRFQPSEFLKPGFAIAMAWILSWRLRDPDMPVVPIVTITMVAVAGLLMLQPNLGATVLFSGVWFVLVLLSGVSLQRIAWLCAGMLALLTTTYFFYENARVRIDGFLAGGGEWDQVGLAQRTLLSGGWTGTGFWLGTRKMSLPEAHTDYIFSVIGEEFGLIWCAIIVLLYLAIVVRVLVRLAGEANLFVLLAGAGLVAQIGGQAFINILVNLQLFPSKGMTLPLVSYGGSSTIAVCATFGLLLAITRRNPYLERENAGLRSAVFGKEGTA